MTEDEKEFERVKVWIKQNSQKYPIGCLCNACEDEHISKPECLHWWLTARKSLREENERLREQANLWAAKAGQVDRRALELWEENGRLKGELAIKDKHLEAFGIMLNKAQAEIARLRGEAPDAGGKSLRREG